MAKWTYYPASTLPAPYDIVWCRFPEHLDLGNPGPKSRPALVMKTAVAEERLTPEVRVMYGTSRLKREERPFDFFVTNFRDMEEAGLYQATRFDFDRRLWLPWAEEFFAPPNAKYRNPAIGHLSTNSMKLLEITLLQRHRRGLT